MALGAGDARLRVMGRLSSPAKTRGPLAGLGALGALAVTLAVAAPSCKPDFGERESFVDRTQVLAVLIEPPEAKPGDTVKTTLVVASPAGPVESPPSSWAFCATPKLLTENGSVSAACLAAGVVPIGDANGGLRAVLPMTGCSDFGPETQSADVRPRDPDVTGGFFQPIRAHVAGDAGGGLLTAFGFARLRCNLASLSADLAVTFAAQYVANVNPQLLPVEARLDGATTDMPTALDGIPRGARVVLRASWRPNDAESYVVFDPRSQSIVTHRESLRVSWFTTAGSFDVDRSGRTEDEQDTFTENTWSAPDDARTTQLWLVLRDARGGATSTTLTITTR
jgi:hypothetical protein